MAHPPSRRELLWTQEARPLGHFTFLLRGIEEMMHTGKPSWAVQRTLLTSGLMDFLLTSRQKGGILLETPALAIRRWEIGKPQSLHPLRALWISNECLKPHR